MTVPIAIALALASAKVPPPPADPLTVEIHTQDADRFAALFERTGGPPTAEQLQREYLAFGSYGVRLFMPNRIRDAANLAQRIAADPAGYAKAVRTCLPIVKSTTAELRATYLALHGLFPDRPLPQIYLVVGAGNSGGTAGPGAQVLGLETLCRIAKDADDLRNILRGFYAHETVHSFQKEHVGAGRNILLGAVLTEGAADFIATIVTGRQMDPARAAWAAPREEQLWRQFEADLSVTRTTGSGQGGPNSPAAIAIGRWVGNYGHAPKGWPGELGYWMGQRIWQRWYAQQPDKRAALNEMLNLDDPDAVLRSGRFVGASPRMAEPAEDRVSPS